MILKHINDIASICAGHGIDTAVVSPGSRSAPLSLAFNQHPGIDVKVIADERSAAFIAMGIAQQQKKPVALICTSGSAIYNYAPAIAEAYYQEIPLLVLSADRPPEWTNQYDGQTIQQSGIFGKHVKASFDLPVDVSHPDALWHTNRTINEAIIEAVGSPNGPVHVNVPLREPFYPEENEKLEFSEVRIIENLEAEKQISEPNWTALLDEWNNANKPVIILGQIEPNNELTETLNSLVDKTNVIIISDIIGNQYRVKGAIQHQDAFLQGLKDSDIDKLVPDLLITVGKSLISKNLKLFLRNSPPETHWHIHPSDRINDTLKHLTRHISMNSISFFRSLESRLSPEKRINPVFNQQWLSLEKTAKENSSSFLERCSFGEFQATYSCLKTLPDNSQLHLANSMSVRYANLIGIEGDKHIEIFVNRGTSGIDGSNSTAVGATLAQNKLVTLITGDMAFFYDRNAFWHGFDLSNLRIIILNNHGGGIFRMIKGPKNQPDYEKLFETEQKLTAENTCRDFGFEYHPCHEAQDLNHVLRDFFNVSDQCKVLEVFSDSKTNEQILKEFKSQVLH